MPGLKNGKEDSGRLQEDMIRSARTYYRRRYLIGIGILASVLLFLLLSFIMPKTYLSEGFYQLSDPSAEQQIPMFSVASEFLKSSKFLIFAQLKDMGLLDLQMFKDLDFKEPPSLFTLTIQEFKKYTSRFENYQEFFRFAENSGILSAQEFSDLKKYIRTSKKLSKRFEGMYALSKDDLKDVGKSIEEERNFISGVMLEMEAKSRNTANRYIQAFGRYIGFSTFQEKFHDYITTNLNESGVLIGRYDNYILQMRSLIKQLEVQRDRLKEVARKYPGFKQTETQMVLDFELNVQRFMSPIAQVVGVESRIVDLETLEGKVSREKKKSELFFAYFDGIKEIMDEKTVNGEELFRRMETHRDEFFKTKDLSDLEIREVFNTINTDIGRFRVLYSKTLRFITGPTLPEKPIWPKKSIMLILGFFAGVFIFIPLAYLLEFWERNKRLIKSNAVD